MAKYFVVTRKESQFNNKDVKYRQTFVNFKTDLPTEQEIKSLLRDKEVILLMQKLTDDILATNMK